MADLTEEQILAFWMLVSKSDGDGCWTWQGAKGTKMRYGVMSLGARGSVEYTHRISWMIANGPIPEGLCVLHSCDNPPCVRPDHLFLGTRTDNMTDKVRKGRQHRGEATCGVVLTDAKATEALELYASGEISVWDLAQHFGVTEATMRALVNGQTWAHVPGPRLSREEIVALGKKHRAEGRRRAREAA